jgi:hypothetical protein
MTKFDLVTVCGKSGMYTCAALALASDVNHAVVECNGM